MMIGTTLAGLAFAQRARFAHRTREARDEIRMGFRPGPG